MLFRKRARTTPDALVEHVHALIETIYDLRRDQTYVPTARDLDRLTFLADLLFRARAAALSVACSVRDRVS